MSGVACSRCAELARALEQIARMTPVFDAKGTASKRINEIAREALAAREEPEEPAPRLRKRRSYKSGKEFS